MIENLRAAVLVGCLFILSVGCRTDAKPVRSGPPVMTTAELSEADAARLEAAGWERRVGRRLGLWVSVARQGLLGIEDGRVRFAYPCSTAAKGVGNRQGSHRTPPGWHEIQERFGHGLPAGAIFKERAYTGRIWAPGRRRDRDMILSRIMWLRGLEPGVNAGAGIDSHERYIYIHGTPEEERLGTPASMGCIRLSNEDVIELFQATTRGTPVLISEW